MTEDEVVEILGGPGTSRQEHWAQHTRLEKELGHPFDARRLALVQPNYGPWILDFKTHKFWTSQHGTMQIGFDPGAYVSGKIFWHSSEPSFRDRLRDWLGW
jgi:hypothetical protein